VQNIPQQGITGSNKPPNPVIPPAETQTKVTPGHVPGQPVAVSRRPMMICCSVFAASDPTPPRPVAQRARHATLAGMPLAAATPIAGHRSRRTGELQGKLPGTAVSVWPLAGPAS